MYIILGVVSCLVVVMSIAFAALSTTLTINFGNVTQSVQTFNFSVPDGTYNATEGGTSDTVGRSCAAATVSSNVVTIPNISLSKPDDSCTWDFNINNTGTIAAKITAVTPTKPYAGTSGTTLATCATAAGGSLVCGNISYTFSYNSSGTTYTAFPAAPNLTLAATSSTKALRLEAKYTGTGVNSSAVYQKSAKFVLTCAQN